MQANNKDKVSGLDDIAEGVLTLPWPRIHFVGIGGAGMSGLALIANAVGCRVTGSDLADSTVVQRLQRAGIAIAVGHAEHQGEDADCVVYSSAVPNDNVELLAAGSRGASIVKRGTFLAELASRYERVVAVAGSHGKTTVTAMLVHILSAMGQNVGYLIGGERTGGPPSAAPGDGSLFVTEVDESDGTQAEVVSSHAVVINIDDDHCWSVGGEDALYRCFQRLGERAQFLLTLDASTTHMVFDRHPNVELVDNADANAAGMQSIVGHHNRLNATFAVRMAVRLGVTSSDAWDALRTYSGVDRRLTCRYNGTVAIIEDYAHHPVEVRAGVAALHERYPGRCLRVVFEPHRYERLARYTADFASALSAADDVWVLKPFGAWVDDVDRADPRHLVAALTVPSRYTEQPFPTLAGDIAACVSPGDVVVLMGAGDITKLVPLLLTACRENGL